MMKKIRLPFRRKKNRGNGIQLSIAFKTSVIYVTLFCLIFAAFVGTFSWGMATRAARRQRMDHLTEMVADRLKRGGFQQADFGSFASDNRVYIEIRDARRHYSASYGTPPAPGGQHEEAVRMIGPRGIETAVRVTDDENNGPAGYFTLPYFIVFFVLLLLLAAVSGSRLIRRMMRPVYEMTRKARSISASDLGIRIDTVRSHDELQELAETFNDMLDRIQRSYEQQRRFVSDASHELRTPLSVISGYANLLRRWGSGDKEVLNESVAKIVDEAANMQQLVDSLLFLARADQKTQPVRFQRFNLSGMMADVAEETKLIDRLHAVRADIEPGISLTADAALIKQAVRAVVENSTKYTPENGTITIGCRRRTGGAELTVADTGVGISAQNLPHIFDRFYKADESRTRGKKGSSGLGLSIVKWIVERHGGKIDVRSRVGSGTAMVIFLPDRAEEEPA